MDTRPALAVVLAALAASAGCVGVLGGPGGDRTPTVTPAPVPPAASPTPTAAPGAGGTADVPAFVLSHRRVLAARDHRFERTVTVTGPNGTFRLHRVRLVETNGSALSRLRVSSGGPAQSPVRNWTRWRAGGDIWSRTTSAAGIRFVNVLVATRTDSFSTGRALPRVVFANGSDTSWSRAGSGRAVSATHAALAEDIDVTYVTTGRPRNVSARAVLARAGYIQRLTVTYDARVGDTTARVRIEQTVSLDPGPVERPAWVPDRAA